MTEGSGIRKGKNTGKVTVTAKKQKGRDKSVLSPSPQFAQRLAAARLRGE